MSDSILREHGWWFHRLRICAYHTYLVEIGPISEEFMGTPLSTIVYNNFENAMFCVMYDNNVIIRIKKSPNTYRDPDLDTSDEE